MNTRWMLSPNQIQKLLNPCLVADYEQPINGEIMNTPLTAYPALVNNRRNQTDRVGQDKSDLYPGFGSAAAVSVNRKRGLLGERRRPAPPELLGVFPQPAKPI
ncbi:hypothetical protein B0H63DRAFT_476878 [Podospora didyma]|uniref:Uncharacterized protein n=1 Tax=Podospora didyma TaxID=330526 RepID=A0AAE0NI35_9PEZI|nr:hypothetical protein B0H63DRAFT_476878 [Podospora didyma]